MPKRASLCVPTKSYDDRLLLRVVLKNIRKKNQKIVLIKTKKEGEKRPSKRVIFLLVSFSPIFPPAAAASPNLLAVLRSDDFIACLGVKKGGKKVESRESKLSTEKRKRVEKTNK
jgi:hypothetical protein